MEYSITWYFEPLDINTESLGNILLIKGLFIQIHFDGLWDWENELSSTIELSSTKGRNSRLPKTELLGGTELSSTTELWTTKGGQNFRLPLNSRLPKKGRTLVYHNFLTLRRAGGGGGHHHF